jgi:hypothetical protein
MEESKNKMGKAKTPEDSNEDESRATEEDLEGKFLNYYLEFFLIRCFHCLQNFNQSVMK